MLKKCIFFNCLKIFFRNIHAACASRVCLYSVHSAIFLWLYHKVIKKTMQRGFAPFYFMNNPKNYLDIKKFIAALIIAALLFSPSTHSKGKPNTNVL